MGIHRIHKNIIFVDSGGGSISSWKIISGEWHFDIDIVVSSDTELPSFAADDLITRIN